MAEEGIMMDPEFDRLAGRLLNGPWFVDHPEDRGPFVDAVIAARREDRLTGRGLEIWRNADKASAQWDNDSLMRERLEEPLGITVDEETYEGRSPSAEEGEMLLGAMIDDPSKADGIAKLASTPEAVREAVGQGEVEVRRDAAHRKPKPPKLGRRKR